MNCLPRMSPRKKLKHFSTSRNLTSVNFVRYPFVEAQPSSRPTGKGKTSFPFCLWVNAFQRTGSRGRQMEKLRVQIVSEFSLPRLRVRQTFRAVQRQEQSKLSDPPPPPPRLLNYISLIRTCTLVLFGGSRKA